MTQARDEAVDAGIVINGLPILAFEPQLDQYFKDYVIGGPGAFMIAAKTFETFAEAILMKMIIEIADLTPARSVCPPRRPSAWALLALGRNGSCAAKRRPRVTSAASCVCQNVFASAANCLGDALLGEAVLGGAGELLCSCLGVAGGERHHFSHLVMKLFSAAPASFFATGHPPCSSRQ